METFCSTGMGERSGSNIRSRKLINGARSRDPRMSRIIAKPAVTATSRRPRSASRREREQQSDSRRGSLSFRGFRATSAAPATSRKGAAAIAGAHILPAGADMPIISLARGIPDSRERGARSTPPRGRIHRRTRCRRHVPATGAPFHRPCEHPPRRECASDRP